MVFTTIKDILDQLPRAYTKEVYEQKCDGYRKPFQCEAYNQSECRPDCAFRENTMDKNETIKKFKRKLCSIYGYGEDLKFVGTAETPPQATGSKAFLEPRDFLTFAIEDSVALDEENLGSTV